MAGSVVLLVVALAMGAVFFWDIGSVASRMRGRLEDGPLGGLYHRMPRWAFRAFGCWCVLFGCGQLVFIYAITRH